jgi:hypothetical protein
MEPAAAGAGPGGTGTPGRIVSTMSATAPARVISSCRRLKTPETGAAPPSSKKLPASSHPHRTVTACGTSAMASPSEKPRAETVRAMARAAPTPPTRIRASQPQPADTSRSEVTVPSPVKSRSQKPPPAV